jgi:hypothetical protein
MKVLCGIKIRYIHLLIQLISGDLVVGFEKGEESFGCLADLFQSTCVINLVSADLN